jgi:hypothetical protein
MAPRVYLHATHLHWPLGLVAYMQFVRDRWAGFATNRQSTVGTFSLDPGLIGRSLAGALPISLMDPGPVSEAGDSQHGEIAISGMEDVSLGIVAVVLDGLVCIVEHEDVRTFLFVSVTRRVPPASPVFDDLVIRLSGGRKVRERGLHGRDRIVNLGEVNCVQEGLEVSPRDRFAREVILADLILPGPGLLLLLSPAIDQRRGQGPGHVRGRSTDFRSPDFFEKESLLDLRTHRQVDGLVIRKLVGQLWGIRPEFPAGPGLSDHKPVSPRHNHGSQLPPLIGHRMVHEQGLTYEFPALAAGVDLPGEADTFDPGTRPGIF